MRQGWPVARSGQRIGLLGGSFDPAHAGHAHLTRQALMRFGLDQVWWLVSPGNPLKQHGPAPLSQRVEQARALMQHPRVRITALEARMQTRFTAQTLRRLIARYPGVRFVWLMGADNLAQFDQWQDWRWIMDHVPVGVLARPGDRISARLSKAARIYQSARIPANASHGLPYKDVPAWCFVNMPMMRLSSSAIRARASGAEVTGSVLPAVVKGG
ncbi:nicotinate-nucleotide adenylyltransferase [Loktanella sp. DSM 29012]|uniref:nicotinate-nucleotide adenylyltransferase n=1 Tax=Loktanella sp. DSM 29012 TaxID=1881056 RepID=UPI000A4AE019|nr:nicotinate-nucleotide adenylyltransferase [Loktanella sp. DSM 29012]